MRFVDFTALELQIFDELSDREGQFSVFSVCKIMRKDKSRVRERKSGQTVQVSGEEKREIRKFWSERSSSVRFFFPASGFLLLMRM